MLEDRQIQDAIRGYEKLAAVRARIYKLIGKLLAAGSKEERKAIEEALDGGRRLLLRKLRKKAEKLHPGISKQLDALIKEETELSKKESRA